MPTLHFRFPGGRYHATPWGHHVNEGLVEWPPSPWRLLRALVSVGYLTQGWTELPSVGRRLFEALAGTLPKYRLPACSVAHSRHYMPLGVLEKGREKTTLVFDAWADVGDGVLVVRWECQIDDEATELLRTLAANLNYLGRRESWVEAELVPDETPLPAGYDAYPHVEGCRAERGWEQVSLLAADAPQEFEVWRAERVVKALEPFPLPEGAKKPTKALLKKREKAVEPYPADLFEALCRDTKWWKGHGWSQPPGSRRVLYWRRSDALEVGAPAPAPRAVPPSVTTMLLALMTPSGRTASLPPIERTLPQAELIHRALVSRVSKLSKENCRELTGKDESGKPLTGHRHVHILPVDLDRDGRLDHVIVHAPMGLGPAAQRAVRELRRTWTKGGSGDLQVALAGQGNLDDLRGLPQPLDRGIADLLGAEAGSRIWTSATPFVPPRYLKPRGKNTLEGQVLAELEVRGLPAAKVELLPWDESNLKLRHAVRVRSRGGRAPPLDIGFAVKIVFEAPVRGPLAIGYGSHFGLGMFVAEMESKVFGNA